jgi:hypothetical protein
MIFRELREFQELMFRACVRNVMLLATLPYHIAQEMRRDRGHARGAEGSEADDE